MFTWSMEGKRMAKANFMKIKMDVKKGKVHKVYDENDTPAEELPGPPDMSGIVDIGTVFMTHSSPGCAYYYYGGKWWKICS